MCASERYPCHVRCDTFSNMKRYEIKIIPALKTKLDFVKLPIKWRTPPPWRVFELWWHDFIYGSSNPRKHFSKNPCRWFIPDFGCMFVLNGYACAFCGCVLLEYMGYWDVHVSSVIAKQSTNQAKYRMNFYEKKPDIFKFNFFRGSKLY